MSVEREVSDNIVMVSSEEEEKESVAPLKR
jgi:hypothetical protein